MEHITNNPELSTAFQNEELQLFFQRFLRELENPYTLKQFLRDGYKKTWTEQLAQLQKSFIVIKKNPKKDGHLDGGYLEVERCIDGVRFKVGDEVVDLIDPKKRRHPIGRMYEDDRGLLIRLDITPEPNLVLTWRDLGRISHELPTEIENEEIE